MDGYHAPMKISELAAATDTPVDTIRYYEREGLLIGPVVRDAAGRPARLDGCVADITAERDGEEAHIEYRRVPLDEIAAAVLAGRICQGTPQLRRASRLIVFGSRPSQAAAGSSPTTSSALAPHARCRRRWGRR